MTPIPSWRSQLVLFIALVIAAALTAVPSAAFHGGPTNTTEAAGPVSQYDGTFTLRVERTFSEPVTAMLATAESWPEANESNQSVGFTAIGTAAKTADVGLSTRGLAPAAGTRVVPKGIPSGWRVTY